MLLWLKWSVLGLVTVVIVTLLILWIGTRLSLDGQRRHSKATAALPLFTAGTAVPDGLMRIGVADLEFRARVWNLSGDGDAVILLHGFPQSSASWIPVATELASRGYRVVAVDQRGYSPGARPDGIDAYTIDKLIGDVLGVADALGFERFHLAGHDWGSAVGWSVALSAPERILSWSGLSVPHPFAFAEAVRSDPDQRSRSKYFLLFRLPWLPEQLLGFNGQRILYSVMYHLMPAEHAVEYRAIVSEPGAMTAVLNYYRAMGRGAGLAAGPETELPVLFLWGNRDPAIGRRGVELQAQYLKGPSAFIEIDGGHWLLERNADETVPAILAHIERWSETSP